MCRLMHFQMLRTLALGLLMAVAVAAQNSPAISLQPFALQIRQLASALRYLGQPLSAAEEQRINDALRAADEAAAVAQASAVLDQHVLVTVAINAESRVAAKPGPALPSLVEHGTRLFLVKMLNGAGVTAPLHVSSPNSGPVYVRSDGNPDPPLKLTPEEAAQRWADISLYDKDPFSERLSGLPLEYRILTIYSRDRGQRSATISFDVGQGTQDIGYRNAVTLAFNAQPANDIRLHVLDENGERTMASLLIADSLGRIYPNPAKRLAPDFPFQPQIYRADGEQIALPAGDYDITTTGGPEYVESKRTVHVAESQPADLSFRLRRWIDPSRFGWYSGDHHVHAAGCSHYQNPTQGVEPRDMMRQIRGEHLNVGCVLTWGPCYYYQKRFFTGADNPLSQADELMHYDLEVSGFPSSHAGHLVLLGLRQQDYPGTQRIEDWPTYDLPILRWAKSQGALAGFAHSGWGLQVQGNELPTQEVPGFDGIGANEYIADVTMPDTVDFISAGDTPYVWELSIWYHTLNVGFRTRISGETDFPCIYDSRVGLGRTYAKVAHLDYRNWLAAIGAGRSYVADGRSHLMDFSVNGVEVGTRDSELRLNAPGSVHVTLQAAAYLDEVPERRLDLVSYGEHPYWDIERARIGNTRTVPVEIIVNGRSVRRETLVADGHVQNLRLDIPIERSSWIAARILPSSHTNPVFVLVGGQPIRASRKSAQWCLAAVDQCWTQKAPKIAPREIDAMHQLYDHARQVYRQLADECVND